jgi:hypothetical protein
MPRILEIIGMFLEYVILLQKLLFYIKRREVEE